MPVLGSPAVSNLDRDPAAVPLLDRAGDRPAFEPLLSRRAPVGESTTVSRYLPTRARTTVGAWCFLDHYGPDDVATAPGMQVGPHPHIGLQTVTWLLEGEVVHHDSLGSAQAIRPGQLNLMTAGSGIAHAEVSPPLRPPRLHGLQLWVALPATDVPPAFAHHADLPVAELDPGVSARVLIGELGGARSPAAVHSPLLGAEVHLSGRTVVPLQTDYEHAVLVVDGAVTIEDRDLPAGSCAYLGRQRSNLVVAGAPSGTFLLLGGEPFTQPLVMWWNFVGRTADEIATARADWEAGRRFGDVALGGDRIPAPPLPVGRLKPR